jgi:hypothetical protein
MDHEGSLPLSQMSAIGLHTEPDESSPRHPIHVKQAPCHHGMARPQVADGGNGPPDMEGNYECIE